ncbi:MAG: zinc ABC transporter ATP-binding protein [Chlamydiae bacterium CG10_big_fil_rev_8_21_14_0_10_35_9]|nr:MAG: zinc ABC transporter ATP-binding protein [Chlamydiae bacterium CG10_big_fil_rev_8_21_14_0_10_35_9]
MSKAIEITSLDFAYETAKILEDVNLTIEEGSYVGIIGPNGGGKTTLLKLIMGFLRYHKGSIRLFGKSPEKFKNRIGYVPQVNAFDRAFPITVEEVILQGCLAKYSFFQGFSKQEISKANEAIQLMRLDDFRKTPFGKLSGGLAQRTLIARALASDPLFLFFDEPTANVDTKTKDIIFQALHDFKGKKTILHVTHDLNLVIKEVQLVVAVEKKVTTYLPKDVCEHFALGLYHPPLIKDKE